MPDRKRKIRKRVVTEEKRSAEFHEAPETTKTILTTGVPCVYLEKGVTKNMGDYNSAKVTIGIMMPLDHTPEQLAKIDDLVKVIDAKVVSILDEEVSYLMEDMED